MTSLNNNNPKNIINNLNKIEKKNDGNPKQHLWVDKKTLTNFFKYHINSKIL